MYTMKSNIINLIKFLQHFALVFEVQEMKVLTRDHNQVCIWRTTQKWSQLKFYQIYA